MAQREEDAVLLLIHQICCAAVVANTGVSVSVKTPVLMQSEVPVAQQHSSILQKSENNPMKRKIFSTWFGLLLTLALFLPVSHSAITAGHSEIISVNVNGTCIQVKVGDAKKKICDGGLQQLDVSWNSGGG